MRFLCWLFGHKYLSSSVRYSDMDSGFMVYRCPRCGDHYPREKCFVGLNVTGIYQRGLVQRIRDRLLLMQHPNYHAFKHDLRNVWTGK